MTEQTPKLLLVRLEDIRRDGGTQSRSQLNSATAARYAEDHRLGARFPEMVLFYGPDDRGEEPDGQNYYWLASGFHRYEAFDQNGVKAIECKVYEGGLRAAILYSVGENFKHGLQRSPQDKRYAVRLLLSDREWWQRSNNWIADKCHVSDTLVATVRSEMIEEWRLSSPAVGHRQSAIGSEPGTKPDNGESTADSREPIADGRPSLPTADSDNGLSVVSPVPALPDGAGESDPDIRRESRSRHGGTRTIKTAAIGGKNKPKIKPVVIETETREIAKKMAQIVRSIPKAVRQAKALRWTFEQFIEEARKIWAEIPVEDEQTTASA